MKSALKGYPYFEVKLMGGRLQSPPQLRGTSIEIMFKRGSIGGTKVVNTERFENTPLDRRRLIEWARTHHGDRFDIEYIASPREYRRRIQLQVIFARGFIESGLDRQNRPPSDDVTPTR